jgi:hypothetical protein
MIDPEANNPRPCDVVLKFMAFLIRQPVPTLKKRISGKASACRQRRHWSWGGSAKRNSAAGAEYQIRYSAGWDTGNTGPYCFRRDSFSGLHFADCARSFAFPSRGVVAQLNQECMQFFALLFRELGGGLLELEDAHVRKSADDRRKVKMTAVIFP